MAEWGNTQLIHWVQSQEIKLEVDGASWAWRLYQLSFGLFSWYLVCFLLEHFFIFKLYGLGLNTITFLILTYTSTA